jgi:phospholipid/cholesterol/gamma-HCH transport system substrate-binding protein
MESKANYTLVGLFIIVFSLALLGFVFWLGKYASNSEEFDMYKTYLMESVSGLYPESPVKFMGLEVGTVNRIQIDPSNSERIEITLKILKKTPIKEDCYAVLGSQGLTGLSFIELKGGSQNASLLKKGDEIPTISSQKSLMNLLSSNASEITHKLDALLTKASALLDAKNVAHVEKILHNLEQFSQLVHDHKKDFTLLIEGAKTLETTSIKAFQTFDDEIKHMRTAADNANELMNSLKTVSLKSDALVVALHDSLNRGDLNFKEISYEATSKASDVLDEMKILTLETQNLIKHLNQNPSDIIFSKENKILGPGE